MVSFKVSESAEPSLYPTPAGTYKYITFALLFHACLFAVKLWLPGSNTKGPFYNSIAFKLEHPGPPVSHITTGSLATLF